MVWITRGRAALAQAPPSRWQLRVQATADGEHERLLQCALVRTLARSRGHTHVVWRFGHGGRVACFQTCVTCRRWSCGYVLCPWPSVCNISGTSAESFVCLRCTSHAHRLCPAAAPNPNDMVAQLLGSHLGGLWRSSSGSDFALRVASRRDSRHGLVVGAWLDLWLAPARCSDSRTSRHAPHLLGRLIIASLCGKRGPAGARHR